MAFVHPSFKENAIYTFNQYAHKICLVGLIYYYHKLSTKSWNYLCYRKFFKSQNKTKKRKYGIRKWDLAIKFDNMT
jgi:hypothetical protein